jgi:hypothetical protein
MATPSQALIKCRTCNRHKPRTQFYLVSRRRRIVNGRAVDAECKVCRRTRTKVRWESQKENELRIKQNKVAAIRRQQIKDAVFNAYGGYICACCGETEKSFLTLDHIYNDGAEFRDRHIGRSNAAGHQTYRFLYNHNFPKFDLQILCGNCQHGKLMNDGTCPHKIKGRCNDYPEIMGVGPSGPKRNAPLMQNIMNQGFTFIC